jgi:hypothetical protein
VHPRVQGDLGEASAIEWLTAQGAFVCKPLFHCPDYDLVADMAGRLVRVEVKTSSRGGRNGRWEVALCTRGGNQSWTGITKRFDPSRCDYVFVHVGDGRRWFIPAVRIEGALGMVAGAPKFREFEIEPGPPLPERTVEERPSTIASS